MTAPQIYVLSCGLCGLTLSAMQEDRAKAWMLDHLQVPHTIDGRLQSPPPLCDTETPT